MASGGSWDNVVDGFHCPASLQGGQFALARDGSSGLLFALPQDGWSGLLSFGYNRNEPSPVRSHRAMMNDPEASGSSFA
jgi:hypothetical protein